MLYDLVCVLIPCLSSTCTDFNFHNKKGNILNNMQRFLLAFISAPEQIQSFQRISKIKNYTYVNS